MYYAPSQPRKCSILSPLNTIRGEWRCFKRNSSVPRPQMTRACWFPGCRGEHTRRDTPLQARRLVTVCHEDRMKGSTREGAISRPQHRVRLSNLDDCGQRSSHIGDAQPAPLAPSSNGVVGRSTPPRSPITLRQRFIVLRPQQKARARATSKVPPCKALCSR